MSKDIKIHFLHSLLKFFLDKTLFAFMTLKCKDTLQYKTKTFDISVNRYPGLMKAGMTFTIEPVLSHGNEMTLILEDGWTAITEDGARAAQAEHTVLITEDGAEILTK